MQSVKLVSHICPMPTPALCFLPILCHACLQSVTLTFKHGIRKDAFSLMPLNQSNTFISPCPPELNSPVFLLSPSNAMPARLPSVAFIADAAKLVAPSTIRVTVALLPRTELVVAVIAGCQRSWNQLPLKSKIEQVRMMSRILQ